MNPAQEFKDPRCYSLYFGDNLNNSEIITWLQAQGMTFEPEEAELEP
jgi:hypothetical protein